MGAEWNRETIIVELWIRADLKEEKSILVEVCENDATELVLRILRFVGPSKGVLAKMKKI